MSDMKCCSIAGCADKVTVQPPQENPAQSSSVGFERPGQPAAIWPPLQAQPTSHLSGKSVLQWLLQLNEADLGELVGQLFSERPSLLKALPVPGTSKDEIVQQNGHAVQEGVVQSVFIEPEKGGEPESEKGGTNPHTPHPSHLAIYEKPSVPTVQFSTPMFFGQERDGFVEIELMRVGPASMIQETKAVVCWETMDGSAKAGLKYRAASGKAEFQPSCTFVQFQIDLLNNDDWDPTLDFYIVLKEDGVENIELHRYHMYCRVKVIDDDAFPSNRFATQLLDDKVEDIPSGKLMLEYFKMNFKNKAVHKGSVKWLAVDALENVIYLFCLVMRVLMINELFMPVLSGEREWDVKSKTMLIGIALCFFVPQHVMHVLDYRRVGWKVGGLSRKLLQTNLMRKYMSYTCKAHEDTDPGLVVLVLFKEIPELVSRAYCGTFRLAQDLGMLVLLLLYQTVGVNILGLKTGEPQWIAINCGIIFLFPLVMAFTLWIRSSKSERLNGTTKDAEHTATSFTIDALANYFLLADYGKRGHAISQFEGTINGYNKAHNAHSAFELNNEFIPKSLNITICALWIGFGGVLVVNGDIEMGTFLANWSVFKRIGDSWAGIYRRLLDMDECFTNLNMVVRLMNLPTANYNEKDFVATCKDQGREMAGRCTSDPDDIAADMIPVCVDNLSHHFVGSPAFANVSLVLQQGKLHILAGRRGSGKTTLLKLIGCRIVKPQDSDGSLLVPAHLRVLHVSKEPLFFLGSLYENLTYGVVHGDKDGEMERVLEICKALDIRPKTLNMISSEEQEAARWDEVLSRSDCQLLNLARGLVTNPEFLCVHKPSSGLGPNTVPGVFKMLQSFVGQRGVFQNMDRFFYRRPRTCIYTFGSKGDETYADVVHEPFSNKMRHSQSFLLDAADHD